MLKLGHKPIQEITVQGISGGLIAESPYHDITVTCLFSPLNELFKYVSVDARAALAVLKCIDSVLEYENKMDISKYEKDTTKVEDKMVEVIKGIQSPTPKKDGYFDSSIYN